MPLFLIFALFIFGLFIGSFLNVVIDRLPKGEGFIAGRSHCEFCKHTLYWYDLIPVVSFILLLGKCRYCKKFIGWKYIVIELSTATLFCLVPLLIVRNIVDRNYIVQLLYFLTIVSSFIVIFYIDLFEGIIPDSIIIFLTIVTFFYLLYSGTSSLGIHLISGLCAFIFFLLINIFTLGKGMGLGDVKFSFFIGFFLGFPETVIALYIAFISGAIWSLGLIVKKRKKFFGSTIAFGPFLIIGIFTTLYFDQYILRLIHMILPII